MEYKEWSWKTIDGLEMYAGDWLPSGKARAVICLIHGVGEHIGRYQWDGEALTRAGYIFTGFDLRGFGKSQGQRGHTPTLETYFDDIDAFLALVADRHPGLPLVLYGHSAAGLLCLSYPPVRRPPVKGVIAAGPGLKSQLETQKFKRFLAKILGKMFPTISIPSGLDIPELSRDPKVVEAYIADPLVHTTVTTGWGFAMLRAIAISWENAPKYPYPLLLMQAGEDRIAYPQGAIAYAEIAPREMVTLKLWPGFKHELHTDPEREITFKYMVDWLEKLLTEK